MSRVIFYDADDWQGLYIDGKLVSEGHNLCEGDIKFLLELSEEYDFKSSDVECKEVSGSQYDHIQLVGNFPEFLKDLEAL